MPRLKITFFLMEDTNNAPKSKTINIITLGCSKNTVDSERVLGHLSLAGFKVVHDGDAYSADTVVINTCGFTADAKDESVEMILRMAYAKREGIIKRLYVMGCLSERYKDDLRDELPEVDAFFGVDDMREVIAQVSGLPCDMGTARRLTTPPHYAYLKISEGCNWGCGYCAIPLIRGRHVSVPMEDILKEAHELAAKGVKELIVIAQDTTYYGMDLYGERRLGELLHRLCAIEGIEWVRLHYAYPTRFPDDVIEAMANEPKICKYLDIPFQHISDNMLSSMRRGITKTGTLALIEKLRRSVPGIALRTTLIVGYPGETEADFKELEEFVRTVRFERLGVFTYSEEEGTYSAENLKDDVPSRLKERRRERIMSIQEEISLDNNRRLLGTVRRVIVDRREGDLYVGRTQYDSPEVDQEVLISHDGELVIGGFYDVRIDTVDMFDLYASVV